MFKRIRMIVAVVILVLIAVFVIRNLDGIRHFIANFRSNIEYIIYKLKYTI